MEKQTPEMEWNPMAVEIGLKNVEGTRTLVFGQKHKLENLFFQTHK